MREFDVIVWGASGFTGRLVSEYLLSQYGVGRDVKWAIGGRNASKLNIFKDQLGAPSLPVLVADIKNRSSLDDLTKQTKVICTTVGPYALYGSEMVASCVANGTHYCDLAGEAQWIRRMIDRHHDEARKNKTRIVHSCGFDSIPSDMGVYLVSILLLYVCYDNFCDILRSREDDRIKIKTLVCDGIITTLLIFYAFEHKLLPLFVCSIVFFLYNMIMLLLKIKISRDNKQLSAPYLTYNYQF